MQLAIDIYSGDGAINFDLMRTTPVRKVICKLSQGVTKDSAVEKNTAEADARGFEVLVYHMYDYRWTADQQIAKVMEFVKPLKKPFRLIVDAEFMRYRAGDGKYYNVAVPKSYESSLRKFTEAMSDPILYANKSFFDAHCPDGLYWASVYQLWVANYSVTAPAIPLPWQDWWGWQ